MLADKPLNAVELSALRQDELQPLVDDLGNLDVHQFAYAAFHHQFAYAAFHAPSSMDPSFE